MRKLLLLAAAVAVFAASAASASALVVVPSEGCNGVRQLCDRRLDQVVLPTAHNAMSAASLGWIFPNQPVGIPQQLAYGVRGLLLDTHYGHAAPSGSVVTDPTETPQSKVYLCHQACQLGATPLRDVLIGIRIFLHFHPRNVIVIVNEDNVSPTDYAQEFTAAGLKSHVWRGSTDDPWPTLRTMIRQRKQVVLLAERDSGVVPWYHEAYNGVLQETRYDWPSMDSITNPANWAASCSPNRGGTTGSLFLMNHWSPPFAPTPAGSESVNATDVLVGRARACREVRGKLPNLVAVDQFLSGGLFEAVRRLNADPVAPG
jgi:hypothetical protein